MTKDEALKLIRAMPAYKDPYLPEDDWLWISDAVSDLLIEVDAKARAEQADIFRIDLLGHKLDCDYLDFRHGMPLKPCNCGASK